MYIGDGRLRPANNNLTLVRLVLASAVIWTHCFWKISGREGVDELSPYLGAPVSRLAVDGFFFLSGFLVYGSLQRQPSVRDFAIARLARIWPALACCVAFVAIGGAFVTAVPLGGYLHGKTLSFIVGTLSFWGKTYQLTGVLCDGAPCVVNGSLWTIPWEVRCYLALGILALVGFAAPSRMKYVILPLSVPFVLVMDTPGVNEWVTRHLGPGLSYWSSNIGRLWGMFALGIAASIWRSRIPLSWMLLALLATATLVSNACAMHVPFLGNVTTAYAVLFAGFAGRETDSLSGRWSDYSYGLYLYAFPVMVALDGAIDFRTHLPLAIATFCVTLPIAALSWHFVEHPVLELVRRRRASRAARLRTEETPPLQQQPSSPDTLPASPLGNIA